MSDQFVLSFVEKLIQLENTAGAGVAYHIILCASRLKLHGLVVFGVGAQESYAID